MLNFILYLFCIPVESGNSIITLGVMQDVGFSFVKNMTNFTSLIAQRNDIKNQMHFHSSRYVCLHTKVHKEKKFITLKLCRKFGL